ncbi:hypothetical protein CTAYLR_007687 [Chrysophaeum taylorii]|uniref:NAD-dependent epimerase/dehydratase domain-containing protein n=1 Tax=Chrysophaeum taylorii TaxID=2483200 RepID=A0AAD7XH20_9STRA|nr:hypothetical protein CTAYLR_007687 [Chrysophaeum taylorii]
MTSRKVFAAPSGRNKAQADGRVRVLVTGSGYVAQHLVAALTKKKEAVVMYTHRREGVWTCEGAGALHMDITDETSVAKALWRSLPDVVVNTAAMASPKACEADPEAATKTNCPLALLETMFAVVPDALFVQLSTDIVLGGDEAPYGDGGQGVAAAATAIDAARPVNAYGRSKLAFEKCLLAWPRCAILRCSNMVGPRAPFTGDGKFVQWLSSELSKGEPVDLWRDEIRSFVDVRAVVDGILRVIELHAKRYEPADTKARAEALDAATKKPSELAFRDREARRAYPPVFLHLNAGGPSPFSRLDLGRLVLQILEQQQQQDNATLNSVSRAAAAGAALPYPSPLDVAMDSSNFERHLGLRPVPVVEAVRAALRENN